MRNRPLQWAVFKTNKPFDFVEFFGTFDSTNIFALRISIKMPLISMPSNQQLRRALRISKEIIKRKGEIVLDFKQLNRLIK